MKSGVGGCIIGIIPGEMAISVISPPLDEYGNSLGRSSIQEFLANELNHSYGNCIRKDLVIPEKTNEYQDEG